MIPDGIEPVVGFRSWRFANGKLRSQHDNSLWEPGKPYEAQCPATCWEWLAVEGRGHTREEIDSTTYYTVPSTKNLQGAQSLTAYGPFNTVGTFGPAERPNVELPEGWGYEQRIFSHDVPDERCSCGVYAHVNEGMHPPNDIRGEVNMWGKVIQGAQAHRSTYAYPRKLYCTEEQEEALKAYGVEVVVLPKLAKYFPGTNNLPNNNNTNPNLFTWTLKDHTGVDIVTPMNIAYGDQVKLNWEITEAKPNKKWWQ